MELTQSRQDAYYAGEIEHPDFSSGKPTQRPIDMLYDRWGWLEGDNSLNTPAKGRLMKFNKYSLKSILENKDTFVYRINRWFYHTDGDSTWRYRLRDNIGTGANMMYRLRIEKEYIGSLPVNVTDAT